MPFLLVITSPFCTNISMPSQLIFSFVVMRSLLFRFGLSWFVPVWVLAFWADAWLFIVVDGLPFVVAPVAPVAEDEHPCTALLLVVMLRHAVSLGRTTI
jgi:hypothetical protein